MDAITGYVIVVADSSADLEEQVRSKLLEGWQLVGGVSIANAGGLVFAQAMVR